jgi:hydroxymethylpyrimidine pyrophosphatase-like HAD family hydrolase
MIRLVATDVDGTLVLPGGTVPGENRAALREAAARGVTVALATIRVRRTAQRIVEQLDLPVPLVCQGGATVFDSGGRLLHEETIPLDLAREIAAFADERRFGLLTTIDGEHRRGPGHEVVLASLMDPIPEEPSNLATVVAAPTRFMVTGERGASLLLERFAAAPVRIVRHYRADGTLIDAAVTAAGATKERGLAILCGHLGVAPGEVLAIGDGESDAPMLRFAGVGVAVGDADPSAREAADWIAPHAAAFGVAVAVRRFAGGDAGPAGEAP